MKAYGLGPALFITFGSLAGLVFLMMITKKGKAMSKILIPDDGNTRTREETEAYWKARWYRTARWADIYNADLTTAQLIQVWKRVHAYSHSSESLLFCADITYDGITNDGEMVSVDGRAMVKCPEYSRVPLRDVLSTDDGLRLCQELCLTTDDAETIQRKLLTISGLTSDRFFFSTLPMGHRGAISHRTAWLGYYSGFHLHAADDFFYSGHSFGVFETR